MFKFVFYNNYKKEHKLEINCTKNAQNEKKTRFVKFIYSIYN